VSIIHGGRRPHAIKLAAAASFPLAARPQTPPGALISMGAPGGTIP
jgi:hypothetical protein